MRYLIVVFHCLMMGISWCPAQSLTELAQAVSEFQNTFNRQTITFNYQKSNLNTDNPESATKIIFNEGLWGQFDEDLLLNYFTLSYSRDPKTLKSSIPVYGYEQLSSFGREDFIFINYKKRTDGSIYPTSVVTDHAKKDRAFATLTNLLGLHLIFSSESSVGYSLQDIASQQATRISPVANKIHYEFQNDYGVLTLSCYRYQNRLLLYHVEHKKLSFHLAATTRKKKLSELTGNLNTFNSPDGLSSMTQSCTIEYSIAQPIKIITSFELKAHEKKQGIRIQIDLKKRVPLSSRDQLRKLRIPLKDGATVYTTDPNLKDIELQWKEGGVVRTVDGKTLAEVIEEEKRTPWILYISMSLAVVVILGCLFLFIRKYRLRKHSS